MKRQVNNHFASGGKNIERSWVSNLESGLIKYLNSLKNAQRIVIFGINHQSDYTFYYLLDHDIKCHLVVDNDPTQQGRQWHGLCVVKPEDANLGAQGSMTVVCTDYWETKLRQLREMNVSSDQIVYLPTHSGLLAMFLHEMATAIKMWRTYSKLRKQFPETLAVCFYPGLGDMYFTGLYLHGYLDRHGLNPEQVTILTASNGAAAVIRMFGFSRVVVLSSTQMSSIRYMCNRLDMRRFGVHYLHYGGLEYQRVHRLFYRNSMTFREMFVYSVFGPDPGSPQLPITNHNTQDLVNYINLYGIQPARTVLLFPWANTSDDELHAHWWSELSKNLVSHNLTVLYNADDSDDNIECARRILPPLDIMEAICDCCGLVVGCRCGLFDLVNHSTATKIVIYHNEMPAQEIVRSSLTMHPEARGKLHEIWLEDNTENGRQKLLEQVLGFVGKELCNPGELK